MVHQLSSKSGSITLYEDEFNKRIRIDDYAGNIEDVVTLIEDATPPWTEKVIIKSRLNDVAYFSRRGYREEAIVKGYFEGGDMHFVVSYVFAERQISMRKTEEDKILKTVLAEKMKEGSTPPHAILTASDHDADELASLYKKSFPIYPTAVGDPAFVRKTIKEGTIYVLIREQGRIVSAASAEVNKQYHNAELTDCATDEGFQGKGYMVALLAKLEGMLRTQGINCFYTIARAESFGMNKAFNNLGFTYGGRMINNCYIVSGLEDMNVWYKS